MKNFLDRLGLLLFDLVARLKGYRFRRITNQQETDDFYDLNEQAGVFLPPELELQVIKYKRAVVRFIAYHRGLPAGSIGLANPRIANRAFEIHGVDPAGEHFEIQSLVVAPGFREGTQFVMMGLFRSMYDYSIRQGVPSWIGLSTYGVYRTMRRYSRRIRRIELDVENLSHPVARYLYAQGIVDTCYVMQVEDFSPWKIVMRYLRKKVSRLPGVRVSRFIDPAGENKTQKRRNPQTQKPFA